MKEIEIVSNQYMPLSNMTSRIFFTLDSMSGISFLYQYSLQHFMEYIFTVLRSNEELSKLPKNNPEARLRVITKELFAYLYLKVSQGLQLEHQPLFALRLAQIRLGGDPQFDQVFELMLKAPPMLETRLPDSFLGGKLTKTQLKCLEDISSSKPFF